MSIKTTAARAALIGLAFAGLGLASGASAEAPAQPITVSVTQSNDGYDRHVTIHNNTGWTMLRFYASDHRKTDWEEDILGADTLPNGSTVRINIDDGSGACVYDFKADFTNGQSLTRMSINVCQIADYYYTR